MGRREPKFTLQFSYSYRISWDADSETAWATVKVYDDGTYDSSLGESTLREKFKYAYDEAVREAQQARDALSRALDRVSQFQEAKQAMEVE
ncbi:MAG: hypothetical protein ACYTBJ_02460 [Planctomycetota bacterium]|jgi:hypothetical protein